MSSPLLNWEVQRQILSNARDAENFLEGVSLWSDQVQSEDVALSLDTVQDSSFTLSSKVSETRQPRDNGGNIREVVESDYLPMLGTSESGCPRQTFFGDAYYRKGDYKAAKDYYSQSANTGCTAHIYANRALCEMKLTNLAKAEADCGAALQLDRRHLKAWQRRGVARRKLGKYLQSIADLEQAARLAPRSDLLRRQRAASQALFKATNNSKPAQNRQQVRFNFGSGHAGFDS
mmetsp:Transcript_13703/g.59826  ORF Transcript_13703/g.59826 Transcript_13703/m.59826 type:complete len:233 (+) Transcript_13703:41-739(+)